MAEMAAGAALSVLMAEAVILVKRINDSVEKMRRNKRIGGWLKGQANLFHDCFLERNIPEEEATDNMKRGVKNLMSALKEGLEICDKVHKRTCLTSLFHASSDSDKIDDIRDKLVLAAQLLGLQVTLDSRSLEGDRYHDLMDLLTEMAEENYNLHASTKEALRSLTKEAQKERKDYVSLVKELIKACQSDPNASSRAKEEQDLVLVTYALSNLVIELKKRPNSDPFYTNFKIDGNIHWEQSRREDINNRFLSSMGSLMKSNTPVLILGVHGMPDMLLEEGIYSKREIMASYRFSFVLGLERLRNRLQINQGSFPADELDKVLSNVIRLDRREESPQRQWYENFDNTANSIRGAYPGALLDPQPAGLVGLIDVSLTSKELFARFDQGNPIWCRIGEWKWHRCVKDVTNNGVRACKLR